VCVSGARAPWNFAAGRERSGAKGESVTGGWIRWVQEAHLNLTMCGAKVRALEGRGLAGGRGCGTAGEQRGCAAGRVGRRSGGSIFRHRVRDMSDVRAAPWKSTLVSEEFVSSSMLRNLATLKPSYSCGSCDDRGARGREAVQSPRRGAVCIAATMHVRRAPRDGWQRTSLMSLVKSARGSISSSHQSTACRRHTARVSMVWARRTRSDAHAGVAGS
jgi:hypothetical protein